MFLRPFILQIIVSVSLCCCEDVAENPEEKNLPEFENQQIFSSGVLQFLDNDAASVDHATNVLEMNITTNETSQNPDAANKTHKFIQCLPDLGSSTVQLMNDTELIKLLQPDPKVTDRDTPGLCVLVLFYSQNCPFSSMAAPHYNALPRAFPDIKMVAINAMMYHLFNTQNGIVGVPSLMLFHSGRPMAKFNDSEYTLELFSRFISKHTGLAPVEKATVTSADFAGPVSSVPTKDSDMLLVMSWIFIISCSGYYFTKSKWWTWIIETVQSNWRESEAHANHEHID